MWRAECGDVWDVWDVGDVGMWRMRECWDEYWRKIDLKIDGS